MNAGCVPRSLEYKPCRYGASKIMFRGPARRISGDYVAFVGGSETFGRYIKTPYPALCEAETGVKSINLGSLNAGVDTYTGATGLIDICSMAKLTVIQIMGAANMSNRFYTVDPRNSERFLRASKRFKEVFPDVDFSQFELTGHMLTGVARAGGDRLPMVRRELQCAWVARMRSLLSQIEGRKVLLWMAGHAPFSAANGGTICRDPLFVDRAMLNAVAAGADTVIEVVASADEVSRGYRQMIFDPVESEGARAILGPVVHTRVAECLYDPITEATGAPRIVLAPAAVQKPLPQDLLRVV